MPGWPEKRVHIGSHAKRIDAPAKVTGSAKYASDVQPEGWLYCSKSRETNVSGSAWADRKSLSHRKRVRSTRRDSRAATMKLSGVVAPLFALRQYCDLRIAAQYTGEANA